VIGWLVARLVLGAPDASGRVTLDDVEAKFRELKGEANEVATRAQPAASAAAVVLAAGLLLLVYLIGRRKGRRRATVLEIRRIV
jgi:hypothetical protein